MNHLRNQAKTVTLHIIRMEIIFHIHPFHHSIDIEPSFGSEVNTRINLPTSQKNTATWVQSSNPRYLHSSHNLVVLQNQGSLFLQAQPMTINWIVIYGDLSPEN